MIVERPVTVDYSPRLAQIARKYSSTELEITEAFEERMRRLETQFAEAIYRKDIASMTEIAKLEPAVLCRGLRDRLPMDLILEKGDEAFVIKALALGVDVDTIDNPDLSLPHILARRGFAKALSFAVTYRGVDPEKVVTEGRHREWKPIDFAEEMHQREVVLAIQELIKKKSGAAAA